VGSAAAANRTCDRPPVTVTPCVCSHAMLVVLLSSLGLRRSVQPGDAPARTSSGRLKLRAPPEERANAIDAGVPGPGLRRRGRRVAVDAIFDKDEIADGGSRAAIGVGSRSRPA